MKSALLLVPVLALSACMQEAEPQVAEPVLVTPAPPAPAVAPEEEDGLCPLNPPPRTWETPREPTALEIASGKDDLQGFIAALAGRQPGENLLVDALTDGAERITQWLCEEQGMRLTHLEKVPYSAVPAPDSPEFPWPEMDEEALAGLKLLFRAGPELAKDDALMATCIRHYCVYRYPKALRYLLSRGANPNGRDAQGRTPLDFASYFQWKEGIRILRENGATERTPGRSFVQKRELNEKHRCAKFSEGAPGSIPVERVPFFIWKDPGPDGPNGGTICMDCGAAE